MGCTKDKIYDDKWCINYNANERLIESNEISHYYIRYIFMLSLIACMSWESSEVVINAPRCRTLPPRYVIRPIKSRNPDQGRRSLTDHPHISNS